MCVSAQHPELVEVPLARSAEYDNLQRLVTTILQPTRDALGKAITIISGYRPQRLNTAVNGSATSAHRYGLAADCICEGNRLEIAKKILEADLDYDQIIIERPKFKGNDIVDCEWVHVGLSRTKNRREVRYWTGGSQYPIAKVNNQIKFSK